MNYGTIDLMAFGGKLAVESTSMKPWPKEGIKLGIDIVANMLKDVQLHSAATFSVMGLSLEQIQFVKLAAKKHDLDRIVVFPCPVNGLIIPCIRMEGGNVAAFCKMVGTSVFPKASINVEESEQNTLIEQYGIILYQKRNTV